jgi:resolvase-like protein
MAKVRTPAVAYLRTSSAANVGTDKDSEHRQRVAVRAFAKRAGFEIADADWFYDAAVSGADPIEGREGLHGSSTALKAMASAPLLSKTRAGLLASSSCRSSASLCWPSAASTS